MEVLTNAEMQRADQLSIAAGTPGFKLMLSAGQAVAEAAHALVEEGPILIVAGPGNNGGGGVFAAPPPPPPRPRGPGGPVVEGGPPPRAAAPGPPGRGA